MDHVELRLYGDLLDLVGNADRDGLVDVPVATPRSVKDLIESVGVPHTDVGLILVDGAAVGFDHLVSARGRVSVYPPLQVLDPPIALRPTPAPRRYVLDVHLGTLARNLRLLGFDCWYRTDADDPLLAEVAVTEQRTLLTRDRGLLMRREIVHGWCLRSQDPFDQTVEIARRFELADHVAAFSRCLRCNGALEPVDRHDVRDDVPPAAHAAHDRFVRCRRCRRIYWPGTHHERLTALVAELTNAFGDGRGDRTTGRVH